MPTTDDELRSLFSALDDVSASDELKDATLARILAASEEVENGSSESALQDAPAQIEAMAGGKASAPTKKAKWRAIRIGAIAACLVLALTGGVAYATPASYYDIAQGDMTISLGVNCFGITVSATSSEKEGRELIDESRLCNIPYEESLERAIRSMEERDPNAPVEYGPQGGEHDMAQPKNAPDDSNGQVSGGAQGEPGGGNEPNDRPQDDGQPQGEGKPQDDGRPQGEGQPPSAPQGMFGEQSGPGNNRPHSWAQTPLTGNF